MQYRNIIFKSRSGGIFQRMRLFSSLVLVHESRGGHIKTISLNDMQTRNSLSRQLMTELLSLVHEISLSDARVIVVKSSIPKVFSSGHNLKELAAKEDLKSLFRLCSDLMCAVRTAPQAVIAEIDGIATAAGCQLVASCDLAIASTSSQFATPGVNIGLFCSTPAVAISRNVSYKHAMEMLLTGDMISAEHAHRIGLVNRVVDADDLESEVFAWSSRIASKSPASIALGKRVFQKQIQLDLVSAYDVASAAMVENMIMRDADIGIDAFFNKTKPQF